MNKKGLYEPMSSKYGFASPILLVGIFIFMAPYIVNAFGGHVGGWLSVCGIIVIFIGAIDSIRRASN